MDIDDKSITTNLSKPGQTSLLPQYIYSEAMYERFLDATQIDAKEIERAVNIKGQFKLTEEFEIKYDNLKFFTDRKSQLEEEFFNILSQRITSEKASLFCHTISENWFDGRAKRNSKPVKQLFASIRNYLVEYKVKNENGIEVLNKVDKRYKISFEEAEIEAILDLNKQMFDGYFNQWIQSHNGYPKISSSEIYFRRGIAMKQPIDKHEYLEWNYINSYSIAFTVTEKFARISDSGIPGILNINSSNLRDRILFFSPFIMNMPIGQFEMGVIPHWWPLTIKNQGCHSGIFEYLID